MRRKKKLIDQHIISLKTQHGTITAALVVKDAKNPKSPLHKHAGFDWNLRSAAYKHWLDHARTLIANVCWQQTQTTHIYDRVSAFVRDPRQPAKIQGYVSLDMLRSNKKLARESIDLEITQVQARLERLRALAEPLGLSAYVEKMIANLQILEKRIAA